MRNKWYVIGIAVPALLLAYWAISLALSDNMVMALIPGGLAGALLFGAYRVAQAPSFTPAAKEQWSEARTPGVMRWLKDHDDGDASSAPPPASNASLPNAKR